MELTSGQRKALFALVVAALTALGIYMFVPGARAARGNGGTPATAHSPAPGSPVSPSAAPAASGTGPAAGGAPPAATTPSAPALYRRRPRLAGQRHRAGLGGQLVSWRWRQDALLRGGPAREGRGPGRGAMLALVTLAIVLVGGLIVAPMLIVGGSGLLFESGSGCAAAQGQQPPASSGARDSVPPDYLTLFQATGRRYGGPWAILAGIGAG